MDKLKINISKFLSCILRHRPQKFGLIPDKYGFVDFNKVIAVLKDKFPQVRGESFKYIIKNDLKERFELKRTKIRARYGHSINIELPGKSGEVPKVLFHGTSRKNLESIKKIGLIPVRRKFVHLSSNLEEAMRVGKRKDFSPIILIIDAKRAQREGVRFWKEGKVYLTSVLPPQYINIYNTH